MQHRRREILQCLGCVGVSGFAAGCNFGQRGDVRTPEQTDSSDLPGHIRPRDERESIPDELVCENADFERRTGWVRTDEIQWGTVANEQGEGVFALRVDRLEVRRGETVTFQLTNVSPEEQQTANIYKSNFEVYTDVGWQDPRGWRDGTPKPITDELLDWAPGERTELTYLMTEEGIVESGYPPHRDDLITCPGLPAGRYRFATAAPRKGDLAVAFDLLG